MNTEISLASTGIKTTREYEEERLVQSGDDELDRNAFLQLLTTQLQNQNPLDPMKNEAFVAQLAQFSQLEGITNMSTSLDEVSDVLKSDRLMTGANLVGKSIFAGTGQISTDGQTPTPIEVDLPYGADQVNLGVYDMASGALLRSMSVGPQTRGTLNMAWDGRNAAGESVPAGSYYIRGEVLRAGGSEAVTPMTYAKVNTVSWDSQAGELKLNLSGGGQLPLSQVSRVGDAASTATATQDNESNGE